MSTDNDRMPRRDDNANFAALLWAAAVSVILLFAMMSWKVGQLMIP